MELTWKAVVKWPGTRTRNPQRSKFKASYTNTLKLIDDELRHLKAKNIVLQADCDESEIRLDGRFRARAVMRSQGIILSLDSMHGPLSWACDRYDSWEDNLRAIGLTMNALRAVSRYGVVREAEQYKGFKALPGPGGQNGPVATRTPSDAAEWLAGILKSANTAVSAADLVLMKDLYVASKRKAQAYCHPDRCQGSRTLWNELAWVTERLDTHHGL